MSQRFPNKSYVAKIGDYYDWVHGGKTPVGPEWCYVQNVYGAQLINQVNKRVNGKYPPGGDWLAYQRKWTHVLSEPVSTVRPYYGYAYKGQYYLRYPGPSLIPPTSTLYGEEAMAELTSFLEGLGAEGYEKSRPAQPTFSAATSLLELKDIPSMLKQSIHLCIQRILDKHPKLYYDFGRNGFFRVRNKTRVSSTAEWYLAISFGWLPILSDIQNFIKASDSLNKDLNQLLRDEGKVVRRRRTLKRNGEIVTPRQFDFPDKTTRYVSNPHSGIHPIHVTQCYTDGGFEWTEEYQVHQLVEFVAAFRYWLPDGPRDNLWNARIRRRMLGGRITPSVAWNLMPWTFLSDYFSSLGSAISNLGPGVEDQLYTEYCYVTYREDIRRIITGKVGVYGFTNDLVARERPIHYVEHSKLRVRVSADPFAFRFFGGETTLKQKAIMAALAAK